MIKSRGYVVDEAGSRRNDDIIPMLSHAQSRRVLAKLASQSVWGSGSANHRQMAVVHAETEYDRATITPFP